MVKKIKLLIFLVACLAGSAIAHPFNKAKMDSLFHAIDINNKGMGSIMISKKGAIIYKKSIGYSSITAEVKKPATDKTRYRIGSISKMFTATLIFQLIEEGKLSLDDKLSKFYPQVPNAGSITLGQMLDHHSGIHNFTSDTTYLTWFTKPKTKEEMLALIAASKPDFEPGTKSQYSNTNFVLLGYIVEQVTGKPYKEVLQKRITSKIGLKDTYYGGKINLKNNECYSYSYTGKWDQEDETDMSIPGGAGAIVSTPADLVKFIEALFGNKLIKESSLEKMKTLDEGYGMGMLRFPFGEKFAYGHNGGIDGFTSNLAYFPNENIAVAWCSNGQVYPMNDILIGVLDITFGRAYVIPDFKTINVSPVILEKYVGLYSTDEFPLKITITRKDNTLMAQATGQSAFPLEAVDSKTFKFDQAGILITFNSVRDELFLKQGGKEIKFKKEQ